MVGRKSICVIAFLGATLGSIAPSRADEFTFMGHKFGTHIQAYKNLKCKDSKGLEGIQVVCPAKLKLSLTEVSEGYFTFTDKKLSGIWIKFASRESGGVVKGMLEQKYNNEDTVFLNSTVGKEEIITKYKEGDYEISLLWGNRDNILTANDLIAEKRAQQAYEEKILTLGKTAF